MRRSRLILYFLLFYEALFLNVLLPVHTRGAMTTDGKHDAPACCCCCEQSKPATDKSPAPSQRDREHCVLCQFAAGLTTPPPITLTMPELGLLEIIPVTSLTEIISLDRISTYFACGPPVSAASISI
jgi:hypothetical protein